MVDANYKPQMGDIIKGNLSGLTYEVVGFNPGKVNFRIKGGGDAGASLTADGTLAMPERFTLIHTAGRKPLAAQAAIDEIDKLRAVLIAEVEERQEKLERLKAAKNRLMDV